MIGTLLAQNVEKEPDSVILYPPRLKLIPLFRIIEGTYHLPS